MSNKYHYSVLSSELINKLDINPEGVYVDCTLGLGGHSNLIASKLTTGKLISIDQDELALKEAKLRINNIDNVIFVKDNFRNIGKILDELNIKEVDGIIYDLGTSYYQLVDEDRGFTYHGDTSLDMRMNINQDFDAKILLATYPEDKLVKILRDYGDEKQAVRLAQAIIAEREISPILTNTRLNEIIKNVKGYSKGKHPSKNVYQAIRIEVNDEMVALRESLNVAINYLKVNGKLLVITFHSLEDRIVKDFFYHKKQLITETLFENIHHYHTSKTVYPTQLEIDENKASRSAKLRILTKLNE
jgi:16S rRNA (cytosine1402-N4)-methyltransferase